MGFTPGGAATCGNGGAFWQGLSSEKSKIGLGVSCYDRELVKSGESADMFARKLSDQFLATGKVIEQKDGRNIRNFKCSMLVLDLRPGTFEATIERRLAIMIYWSNEEKRVIVVSFNTAKSDWETYKPILSRIVSSIKIDAKGKPEGN